MRLPRARSWPSLPPSHWSWRARGFRANSVCPGFIDTPFNNPAIAFMGGREEQARVVDRMVPMGRQAMPAEVGPLYVYLLSDELGYVTAQALSIDGGVYN